MPSNWNRMLRTSALVAAGPGGLAATGVVGATGTLGAGVAEGGGGTGALVSVATTAAAALVTAAFGAAEAGGGVDGGGAGGVALANGAALVLASSPRTTPAPIQQQTSRTVDNFRHFIGPFSKFQTHTKPGFDARSTGYLRQQTFQIDFAPKIGRCPRYILQPHSPRPCDRYPRAWRRRLSCLRFRRVVQPAMTWPPTGSVNSDVRAGTRNP